MLFTPLSGDAHSPSSQPLCYVLQIDDIRILLDCGSPEWCPESQNDTHWQKYTASLKEVAPTIDLVLLSHGDLAHIGLFPYAHARWRLQAPVYASLPVQNLGRIALTEESESIRATQEVDALSKSNQNDEDKPDDDSGAGMDTKPDGESGGEGDADVPKQRPLLATPQEITTAFDSITALRYSQPAHLTGKCQGLTITAYSAGHTLGGTMWKIRSASSGTILYAVNLNHMKERHLDGTALLKGGGGSGGGSTVFEPLARPDFLITDAERTLMTVPRRKDRDALLLDSVTSTLEDAQKSVLIPCDSSSRVLELLLMFDQHWQFARLRAPISFVSRTGKEMISMARSLVEWMGGSTVLEDDDTGTATLKLKNIEIFATTTFPVVPSLSGQRVPPRLILAVPASLSHGPSRAMFKEFAQVEGNLVVLTSRGETGSLSRLLVDKWREETGISETGTVTGGKSSSALGRVVGGKGDILTLPIRSKVPLEGDELEEYLAQEREAKEKEAAAQGALARSQRVLEADEGGDESDTDSEDEEGDEGDAANDPNAMDIDANAAVDWAVLDSAGGDDAQRAQALSFDIFLKNNVVSRTATSFFRSDAPNEAATATDGAAAPADSGATGAGTNGSGTTNAAPLTRYRMFPLIERRRRVDAYGEVLDVGAWMRKGKAMEEESKAQNGGANSRVAAKDGAINAEEKDPEHDEETEVPSKFLVENVEVPLRCQLLYVDMEGLNDGRAIKTIVPQVNPRKMIIVHASDAATEALKASCSSIRTMTKEIFSPVAGETLTVGQQTNTYTIALSDQVLDNVIMSRFEDNQVGYIYGRIAIHGDSSIPILEASTLPSKPGLDLSTESSSDLHLAHRKVLAPRHPSNLPQSTIIGDLKLTILKSRLASLGISAEFAGEGVLVCNGASGHARDEYVAVKKSARGQIVLEGAPSGVYYTVRQEVYGLHAVVIA